MATRADDRVSILVVDDLAEKHLVFETVLAELGENLIAARSGAEALQHVLERDFAVILMDVNMPGMDGYETAALIRKRKQSARTPIIFITAFAEEAQKAQGYALGAVDYILSPVVPEILRTKIKVFVDLYRMTQEAKRRGEELVALADEELRASNALRQAIVESALDCIITIDHEGKVLEWNPAAEKTFGYARADVMGKALSELVVPERFHESHYRGLAHYLATGEGPVLNRRFEMTARRADGSEFPVELAIVPIIRSQRPPLFTGYVSDITQRKRAEGELLGLKEQLDADLARMRRLHEISTRLVRQGDLPALLEEILDAAIELTHADLGNIQLVDDETGGLKIVAQRGFGQEFLDFFKDVHDDVAARGLAACGSAMQTGQRVVVEDVANHPLFKDTKAREVMLRAGALAVQSTPLFSRAGKLLGIFSTHYRTPRWVDEGDLRLVDLLSRQAADLIERQLAEQALRQSEERYRSVVENASQGILVQQDGIICYANAALARIFGYASPEELIGRNRYQTLAVPEEWPTLRERDSAFVRGERLAPHPGWRGIRQDGTTVWISTSGTRISWQGRPAILAFYVDISEAKRAEEERRSYAAQLEERNAALLRSNQELDDFAYIASHDLREPLRGIYNYAAFLIEDYGQKLDEEGHRKLQTLARLAQRMDDLIESLLQFSRVGRVELAVRPTDLNEVVRDVLDALQISLENARVEVRVPEVLPTVTCDRVRIGEVFHNLITNALKYNDKEDKWIEIGCQSVDGNDTLGNWRDVQLPVLYVRDNGIGIREKHLDAIFRIFKRLHARDAFGGGAGAGLTIVKKIIEKHQGRIWVESRFGSGTTFYFTLNLEQSPTNGDRIRAAVTYR